MISAHDCLLLAQELFDQYFALALICLVVLLELFKACLDTAHLHRDSGEVKMSSYSTTFRYGQRAIPWARQAFFKLVVQVPRARAASVMGRSKHAAIACNSKSITTSKEEWSGDEEYEILEISRTDCSCEIRHRRIRFRIRLRPFPHSEFRGIS